MKYAGKCRKQSDLALNPVVIRQHKELQEKKIMTIEQLKALPKAELHCHLDGSLSREFMERQLGRRVQQEELSVSDDCTSLAEYLEKFSLPGQCIMDEKGLEAAGYDVLRTMSQENVRYAEIRFAPLLSETSGMNCRAVIEAVLKGLERGRADFGNGVWCDYLCHASSQPGGQQPDDKNSP